MLTIQDLSFSWPMKPVVRFPDFQVAPGKIKLILGGSGTGKTTLLHLIGGLLRPATGTVKLQGIELTKLGSADLDKIRGTKMGYIFQQHFLIKSLTVRQNLLMPVWLGSLSQDQGLVDSILEKLGLQEKTNSLVGELSYGQQQRVAIGRALVHRPALIIADEPTSALDDDNCYRVMDLLSSLCKEHNAALLIATHDHRLKTITDDHLML